jgi:hypothetical protein
MKHEFGRKLSKILKILHEPLRISEFPKNHMSKLNKQASNCAIAFICRGIRLYDAFNKALHIPFIAEVLPKLLGS